ncbi:efflux RND transporter periplasmic adaptor subunit [Ovoidimarina sediminis]|uniref:efflux RND transporter periplasmic adaptor subunit n=1 Tax=Ovoidimarina sediminis TaxID=3079856 RepID=UPI00290C9546|nr:efflux RND transporter periplasmic adaptor subunit [Rhodophyticola sp. MJ-SS7]MDU8945233.1 efflux RND transporter periplasmic adaptor subunit [Rhodophyticola sp. MJ-SS7]
MRILIDVVDPLSVECRGTALDTVHFVALFQQKLCQIRAVLPGNPCNERSFHIQRSDIFPEDAVRAATFRTMPQCRARWKKFGDCEIALFYKMRLVRSARESVTMLRYQLFGAFLFASLAALPHWAEAQGRPAGVAVAEVTERTMAETVPVFAEVVTARDGTIAARVSGLVSEVHVLEGSKVAEGDLLTSLDTELAKIELRQAEARLAEANAGVETAKAREARLADALERIERLRDTASFSQGRFEEAQGEVFTARGQLAEAEARVHTAEANIAEVQYRLNQAEIRAPFAGTVLDVETNPGEFIASGAPVVRLLDTRALEVEASVPSVYVEALEPGATVSALTEGGTPLDLVVRAVLPLEDIATRTRPVRFVAADTEALRRAAVGQSVTVEVPAGPARELLAVPKDALVQSQGGWTVFIAADGVAEPRPIEIGAAIGAYFEVLSGLTAGDQVVVRGNERLRPGQPISPQPSQ